MTESNGMADKTFLNIHTSKIPLKNPSKLVPRHSATCTTNFEMPQFKHARRAFKVGKKKLVVNSLMETRSFQTCCEKYFFYFQLFQKTGPPLNKRPFLQDTYAAILLEFTIGYVMREKSLHGLAILSFKWRHHERFVINFDCH